MTVNWQELKITPAQLDRVLDSNLIATLSIDLGRVLFLRRKQDIKSLLIAEVSGFFLYFLLFFPIILILLRNLGWASNNTTGFGFILIATTIISGFSLVLANYYLWRKAKQLKTLVMLLDKVRQYNHLINNLDLVAELNALSTAESRQNKEITELKTALNLTRNSLIKSLELEKIITRDLHLSNNRDLLLTNLESGLVNLDSLLKTDTSDYHQLCSEAIKIGLSVHREIRKHQQF